MESKIWLRYLERQKKKEEKKIQKEEKKKKGKKELELDKLKSEQDMLMEHVKEKSEPVVEPEEKYKSAEYESGKDSKLELLDLDDTRPSGYGNGKYCEYSEALKSRGLLDYIKELLDKQNFIIVRNIDIANKLGKHFVEKQPSSIYWGLKYTLFNEGIVCEERAHISDIGKMRKLLYMRKRKVGDQLPHSLERGRKKMERNRKKSSKKEDHLQTMFEQIL
jgi:hypothetical protein